MPVSRRRLLSARCIRAYGCEHVLAYGSVHVHTCVCLCVHVVHARFCVPYLYVCLRAFVHAYARTCVLAYACVDVKMAIMFELSVTLLLVLEIVAIQVPCMKGCVCVSRWGRN